MSKVRTGTVTFQKLDPEPEPKKIVTVPQRCFQEGEDILVQGQDGLLYFGIVVEVEVDLGQCLVR